MQGQPDYLTANNRVEPTSGTLSRPSAAHAALLARSCSGSSWLVGAAMTLNFAWDEEKAKANLKNH